MALRSRLDLIDYDEVIVHEQDLREPVYETKQKDEDIIKCIGQLRVTYKYEQYSFQLVGLGTGTVYKSITQNNVTKSFIITCAHNVRQIILHCIDCRKYMNIRNDKDEIIQKCVFCDSMDLKNKMIKATQIQFKRRSIHELIRRDSEDGIVETRFGAMMKCYSDCNCEYVDANYQWYSSASSGYDLAFLSFLDVDAYYPQYCTDTILTPGQRVLADTNKFYLFGYPGDKPNKMYGMESSLNCDFNIKENHETHMLYLQQREIDTAGGQSGSAIWCKDPNNKTIICGVHTGGNRENKYNVATLLSDESMRIGGNLCICHGKEYYFNWNTFCVASMNSAKEEIAQKRALRYKSIDGRSAEEARLLTLRETESTSLLSFIIGISSNIKKSCGCRVTYDVSGGVRAVFYSGYKLYKHKALVANAENILSATKGDFDNYQPAYTCINKAQLELLFDDSARMIIEQIYECEIMVNDLSLPIKPICLCGVALVPTPRATRNADDIICRICDEHIDNQKDVFHCSQKHLLIHPSGYDICIKCAREHNTKFKRYHAVIIQSLPENGAHIACKDATALESLFTVLNYHEVV
eukprot:994918_1